MLTGYSCIELTSCIIKQCESGDQAVLIQILCKFFLLGSVVQDSLDALRTPRLNICGTKE